MSETKRKETSRWSILIIMVMGTFMAALDASIVNVALPNMARELQVSTSSIQLVATSYLVVVAGIVLIFGRLGDMLGKTRMFMLGLGLFTLSSLLCGITHSFPVLIMARVIQAIGAAGLMANNQGIVTEVFPPSERGKALGILGTAVALGSLVGPGLGGLIVGAASWEYIFLINIPIGIVVLFFAVRLLPRKSRIVKEKLDGLGALLFMVMIVSLFFALNEGLSRGFTSPVIITAFALSVTALISFIILEKKREYPLLQLQIFSNRLFSLSIFCGFISYIVIFCNNIILPFYLQDVRAYEPQQSGLILMLYPLVLSVTAPVGGYLSDKIGSEILTFIGLILISTGMFFMSILNAATPLPLMLGYIAFMSVGMGLFQSPNNSLVMSTVPKNKLGIAGSVNALVRNTGMACGIALATTLLYGMMSRKLGYRVTNYVPGRSDAFIYGMRAVYIAAGSISLVGVIMTLIRLLGRKSRQEVGVKS